MPADAAPFTPPGAELRAAIEADFGGRLAFEYGERGRTGGGREETGEQ